MSRLFHSLVVCGAGLTLLDCGGRSVERDPADEPSTSGKAPVAGGSGGATTGGSFSSGGASLGGGAGLGQAGALSTGGASVVLAPAGAEGRWSCTKELTGCTSGTHDGYPVQGFVISSACPSDMTRPASTADCPPNASINCAVGFFGGETVLFNCECSSPKPDDKCQCPAAQSGCFSAVSADHCDAMQTVCGCAMTCIAK